MEPYEHHTLKVNWMVPATPCAVDMYTVYYQLITLDQCNAIPGEKTKYRELTDTRVDIRGLHAYTTYKVYVRAGNAEGYTETSTSTITGIVGEK